MAVTTTQIANYDQFVAALTALAPGSVSSCVGELPLPGTKVITGVGATDAQVQSALNTAATQFVSYVTTKQTLEQDLQTHLTSLQAWVSANPSGAVLTAAQTLFVANSLIGLIYLTLGQLTSTVGA